MPHLILGVHPGSPAALAGIRAGETLLTVNGEKIIDEIDYDALCATEHLRLELLTGSGKPRTAVIHKEEYEPLGLRFGDSMVLHPRLCANRCIFCFVDQMCPGLRDSLYIKDDDWRMSLMMGSFITMTNINERELQRIIRRKASPLYISVHTTNMQLRSEMLGTPMAALLMDQMKKLKANSIAFHTQVVLCPGYNDADELDRTLYDLGELYPAVKSIALVPVGLTRFRQHLMPLIPYDHASAAAVLSQTRHWQKTFYEQYQTRLVFAADEFYCLAQEMIPSEEEYEGYPQIENGVGMIRQFEEDLKAAAASLRDREAVRRHVLIACGVSIAPYMENWIRLFAPDGVDCSVQAVKNRFFGETVTVSGLLTGADLIEQLHGADADEILLPSGIFRSEGDLTLDNMTLDELSSSLPAPIRLVSDGYSLFEAMLGME